MTPLNKSQFSNKQKSINCLDWVSPQKSIARTLCHFICFYLFLLALLALQKHLSETLRRGKVTLIFLHCAFSNVSSNSLPEKMKCNRQWLSQMQLSKTVTNASRWGCFLGLMVKWSYHFIWKLMTRIAKDCGRAAGRLQRIWAWKGFRPFEVRSSWNCPWLSKIALEKSPDAQRSLLTRRDCLWHTEAWPNWDRLNWNWLKCSRAWADPIEIDSIQIDSSPLELRSTHRGRFDQDRLELPKATEHLDQLISAAPTMHIGRDLHFEVGTTHRDGSVQERGENIPG